MKGDFTRVTFRPDRHYSGVRLQQGRVQLDADWNEQVDIQAYRDETTTRDIVGLCGAPWTGGGFAIGVTAAPGASPFISAGRMYVDGILCENEQASPFTAQSDYPGAFLPKESGVYLAYLDVWRRHLTALDEPSLREVALGGPDTATRTRTVWQARLQKVADDSKCSQFEGDWSPSGAKSTGRLSARAIPVTGATGECLVPPAAGYRRLENQLYRVEVHDPGGPGAATFKWSRGNGIVVARVEAIGESAITVSEPGKDPVLGFAGDQWVELSDEGRTLRGEPGILVELASVQDKTLTVKSWPNNNPVTMAGLGAQPTVRRWDSAAAAPVTAGQWLDLEDGVQVRFASGEYQTGDYWLIPARTRTGNVEWPQDSAGPTFEPRHGTQHHACPLALLRFNGSAWTVKSDCRPRFPAGTELTALFYVSGDGQEGRPGKTLPRPLQVGVANGQWPVPGAEVRFRVVEGGGKLESGANTGADVLVPTKPDGVAECRWTLGDASKERQVVEATLAMGGGLPLRFNATCEPGVHVTAVVLQTQGRPPLRNDTTVPVAALAQGIRVECDAPVETASIKRPTGSVTLEMPLSEKSEQGPVWGTPAIGYQRLVLAAKVTAEGKIIRWMPGDRAQAWLMRLADQLPRLLEGEQDPGLLARLTLKGSFIWGDGDPSSYLDGDAFAQRGDGRTHLRLPSGDGRRGGDFEMWFWLVRGATLEVKPQSGKPGATVAVTGRGYPPGSAVEIAFGGRVVAHATTDLEGNFQSSLALPPDVSPGETRVTGTAGQVSAETPFRVTVGLKSFTAPATVAIGGRYRADVGLTGPAPAGGARVTLSSGNAVLRAFLADRPIDIPAGQSSAFRIVTVPRTLIGTSVQLEVTASYAGETLSRQLTVRRG